MKMSHLIASPFIVAIFAAWLAHVLFTYNDRQFAFMILGAIVFPVGIIHGIAIFLGFWK